MAIPKKECDWHGPGPHGRDGPARPDRGQESNLHVDAGTYMRHINDRLCANELALGRDIALHCHITCLDPEET